MTYDRKKCLPLLSAKSLLSRQLNNTPSATLLQRLSYPLGNLRRWISKVLYKLPICAREQEDKDDIDKEEQKVSVYVNEIDTRNSRKNWATSSWVSIQSNSWRGILGCKWALERCEFHIKFITVCSLSSRNGTEALSDTIAKLGNEFCTNARTVSLLSIKLPSHGRVFLISL